MRQPAPGRDLRSAGARNARVVLELVRRGGAMTRGELAARVRLSIPSVTAIVRRLTEEGLLVERRREGPPGDRAAMEYILDPDGALAIGLRLRRGPEGGCDAVLVDLAGRIRGVRAIAEGPLAPACLDAARLLTEAAAGRRIVGIGLAGGDAVPPDLVDTLRRGLAPRLVRAERESVALALAEAPDPGGGEAAEESLVVITLGRTVRAGLILDGHAFAGASGLAGRIGRMRTGADRVPLDSVAALPSLEAALLGLPGAAAVPGLAARLALPGAEAVVTDWTAIAADHLVDAIVALSGFTAPQRVLIGGDLPDPVIDALIARMEAEREGSPHRPVPPPWLPRIARARHPRHGIALGAALSVLFETVLLHPSGQGAAA